MWKGTKDKRKVKSRASLLLWPNQCILGDDQSFGWGKWDIKSRCWRIRGGRCVTIFGEKHKYCQPGIAVLRAPMHNNSSHTQQHSKIFLRTTFFYIGFKQVWRGTKDKRKVKSCASLLWRHTQCILGTIKGSLGEVRHETEDSKRVRKERAWFSGCFLVA